MARVNVTIVTALLADFAHFSRFFAFRTKCPLSCRYGKKAQICWTKFKVKRASMSFMLFALLLLFIGAQMQSINNIGQINNTKNHRKTDDNVQIKAYLNCILLPLLGFYPPLRIVPIVPMHCCQQRHTIKFRNVKARHIVLSVGQLSVIINYRGTLKK